MFLFFVSFVLFKAAVSLRVPTPYYAYAPPSIWDSTAGTLWNSTRQVWNTTHLCLSRLRQQSCPPPPRPSSTDDVVVLGSAKEEHSKGEGGAESESLTEYLARLEERLANMEQQREYTLKEFYQQQQQLFALQRLQQEQQEQLILAEQAKKPLRFHKRPRQQLLQPQQKRNRFFIVELIRLFFVTALPVIVFGSLLGLCLVAFTQVLAILLEWYHPVAQTILRKSQMMILISAQLIVDLLDGRSFSSGGVSSVS